MKKEKSQKVLLSGIAMVVLFILWTVAISLIDVQPIGHKTLLLDLQP